MTLAEMINDTHNENLGAIVSGVLDRWPEHASFLAQRFDGERPDQIELAEAVARRVWTLVGSNLDEVVGSYRWMCEKLLEEQLYFRRHGRYRHSSVREVEQSGYLDDPCMVRYHQGLLLSQVLWLNHARVIGAYAAEFLGRAGGRGRLLEVGPGHGLFLALAAGQVGSLSGWDISESSLRQARENLLALGVDTVDLVRHDIRGGPLDATFDLVVASELLEHVEDPADVLRSLLGLLEPDGLVFLNVPVNSPAPDHIYLWRSPEEFFDFVTGCGVDILTSLTFPMTGYSEERARRHGYTISCIVVGRHSGR